MMSYFCFTAIGRPQSVDLQDLHNLFESYRAQIVTPENKIIGKNEKIWNNIKQQCTQKRSTQAIFIAANRWWKAVKKDDSMSSENNEPNISIETSRELNESFSSNEDNSAARSIETTFSIWIAAKIWLNIRPVECEYKRKPDALHKTGVRKYISLKPGLWTNVIAEKISEKREDLPCSWNFKRNKCYESGNKYVQIDGSCAVCKAVLVAVIAEKPNDDQDVKINVTIIGINERRHKNAIKSKNKNMVVRGRFTQGTFPKNTRASTIRREMIRKSARMFKKPTSRILSGNAIRCRLYRERQKEKFSANPFESITYLQESTKHYNTVRRTGWKPFFLFFVSPEQEKLYKVYKKRNIENCKVSCDATGGLVRKLSRPGGQVSANIFLYTMVISDGFQVPIYSALSEDHSANFLQFWLSEFVKIFQDIPKMYTCDMSLALVNAAVRAFCGSPNIVNYLDKLYNLHNENQRNEIPPCLIRFDFAHLMHNVTKSESLRNKPKKVKDFFVRSVALLIPMRNLTEAKNHITSVLIVAKSQTEGTCRIHAFNDLFGNIF